MEKVKKTHIIKDCSEELEPVHHLEVHCLSTSKREGGEGDKGGSCKIMFGERGRDGERREQSQAEVLFERARGGQGVNF